MSYAQDTGYTPRTFAEIMDALRVALNTEFSMTYTAESFVGSYWYRYLYQPVQQISLGEIKTSEIFIKLQEYIATTNLTIQRPSTSLPGIIDSFAANGWVASVRRNVVGISASGTWTLVSVVATDEADVGGVAFTFTATPTLETHVLVTVPSPSVLASATDVNTSNGELTEDAHGFETGDVGQMTTSSALPTGFALLTNYYVIRVSSGVYKLAASMADALAGTAIVPTTTGTGNQTVTLVADTFKARKLSEAVNAHSTIGEIVTASYSANVVTVTARSSGIVGNVIQFTDQDSTITSSGSGYLAGATGEGEAGKVSVCVDVDEDDPEYDDLRLEICTFLKDFIAAGMVFEGTEEETITLSNGQDFDFKFFLPTRIPVLLKLTLTSSDNQDLVIPDNEAIRQVVFDNIKARYRLGWDFEPQRYFTQVDAPWAATILLQWSLDDGSPSYLSTVFEADFKDLYTFDLEDIEVLVDP